MIIDASVIVAILRLEPEARLFLEAIEKSDHPCIAAPTYLEACMVMSGSLGEQGQHDVDQLIATMNIEIVPFRAQAAKYAVGAFLRYGKSRKHKAQLNFGDCISYAMSKTEAMPLLFKGEDFAHTDVERAL